MRRLPLLLAVLVLALAAGPGRAGAEEDLPLFVPPPSGDKDLNLPQLHFTKIAAGHRTILFAWGGIGSGDSERFREAIEEAKPIEEVWLFSGGGVLEEGLEIGRIVHRYGLTTRIRHGMQCISACNFIFMGGALRYVEPGAVFGVHMFANSASEQIMEDMDEVEQEVADYNKQHAGQPRDPGKDKLEKLSEDIKDVQQDAARTAAEIARFLTEMQLSLRFLTEFANIPNENWRPLTRDELRDFNVVNTD